MKEFLNLILNTILLTFLTACFLSVTEKLEHKIDSLQKEVQLYERMVQQDMTFILEGINIE